MVEAKEDAARVAVRKVGEEWIQAELEAETTKELDPFVREPLSKGRKPVYALPMIGQQMDI